jgi:hypothetical protein
VPNRDSRESKNEIASFPGIEPQRLQISTAASIGKSTAAQWLGRFLTADSLVGNFDPSVQLVTVDEGNPSSFGGLPFETWPEDVQALLHPVALQGAGRSTVKQVKRRLRVVSSRLVML